MCELRLHARGRKQKAHTYYRCHPTIDRCLEKCAREDRLIEGFAAHLRELVVPAALTQWLRDSYVESDTTERAARERTIKQHQRQVDALENKIKMLYDDRLNGVIDAALYTTKAGELRVQKEALLRQIEQARISTSAPVEAALQFMESTSRLAALFVEEEGHMQRRLLRTIVKTATWKGGALGVEFEDSFEMIRGSNRASVRKDAAKAGSGRDSEIWLPGRDSNFLPII